MVNNKINTNIYEDEESDSIGQVLRKGWIGPSSVSATKDVVGSTNSYIVGSLEMMKRL